MDFSLWTIFFSLFKIVFEDQDRTKVIYGNVDVSDPTLVKIQTDRGDTLFVNKTQIIFMKEVGRH